MRTLLVLMQKEFRQFFRNKFLTRIVVMYPILIICIIPFITNMDVKHLSVAIVDNDNSSISRRMIGNLQASDYFSLKDVSKRFSRPMEALEKGKVDVIIDIPDDYEKSLMTSSPKKISISANGVNATKGSLGSSYASSLVTSTLQEVLSDRGASISGGDLVSVSYFYNPTLNYKRYMIPALIIMTLLVLCGFLPALNLVGEKEKGTIEQINVTPVGKFQFTLAKILPYWIMGICVLFLCMLLAGFIYSLWPVGSIWAIILAALIFIFAMSGLGVFVSNESGTMLQAMFLMFFFIVIFMLMSGLMTPLDSMPKGLRYAAYTFPITHIVEIMRDVYLKGTTIRELWLNYSALTLLAIFFDTLAVLTYKKQG
jgi:ABC-2 type transport system permease protein